MSLKKIEVSLQLKKAFDQGNTLVLNQGVKEHLFKKAPVFSLMKSARILSQFKQSMLAGEFKSASITRLSQLNVAGLSFKKRTKLLSSALEWVEVDISSAESLLIALQGSVARPRTLKNMREGQRLWVEVSLALAEFYAQQKNLKKAKRLYRQLSRLLGESNSFNRKDDYILQLDQALKQWPELKLDQARNIQELSLQQLQRDSRKGIELIWNQRFYEAKDILLRASRSDPSATFLQVSLGYAYLGIAKQEILKRVFRESVDTSMANLRGYTDQGAQVISILKGKQWQELGEILWGKWLPIQGYLNKARQCFYCALRSYPDDLQSKLGGLEIDHLMIDSLDRIGQKADEIRSVNTTFYQKLEKAKDYIRSRRFRSAERVLEQIYFQGPTNIDVIKSLIQVYTARKKQEELQYYQTLLRYFE